MDLIYLASPYTYKSNDLVEKRAVEQNRYMLATDTVAALFKKGYNIFSPIAYWHQIAVAHSLRGDFEFWKEINTTYINACKSCMILDLPLWKESKGIQYEITQFRGQGKKIQIINWTLLLKSDSIFLQEI